MDFWVKKGRGAFLTNQQDFSEAVFAEIQFQNKASRSSGPKMRSLASISSSWFDRKAPELDHSPIFDSRCYYTGLPTIIISFQTKDQAFRDPFSKNDRRSLIFRSEIEN